MNFQISVAVDGDTIATRSIGRGKHNLGNRPDCAIVVNHPEVAAVAAMVEVTGDVVFLQNRNEFPIFVGADPISPGGIAEWRTGAVVQLTRSVTLALEAINTNATPAATTTTAKSSQSSSLMQIGVIIACAVLGYYMLANESQSGGTANAGSGGKAILFDDVIKSFEQVGGVDFKKLSYEERTLMGYLTEARSLERRLGKAGKDKALAAYELVLSSRLHHDPQTNSELAAEAAEFVANRIAVLK